MCRGVHQLWLVPLLTLVAPVAAAGAADDSLAPGDFAPGEVIVRFEPGVGGERRASIRSAHGATARKSLRLAGVQLLGVGDRSPVAVAGELEKRPEVVYAEPNFVHRISPTLPNDPRFGDQPGLQSIAAPDAWDITTGSAGVSVGVTDSGVATDHPDLAPNIGGAGFDFVANDADPADENGHGTHVAGIAAARGNNGLGVAGVSWDAGIVPIRVCGAAGGCLSSDIADGFDFAGDSGLRVVNGSFGGPNQSNAVAQAIDAHPGTLYVVAAGNDGANNDSTPSFPCNFPSANLICVAATDQAGNLAGFSNFGATSVDLAAPGDDILSAQAFETLFTDNFGGSGLPNWTTGGPGIDWSRTSPGFNSTFAAADSDGGDYENDSASFMRKATTLNLAGRQRCRMDFRVRLNVAAGDTLRVQGAADGNTYADIAVFDNGDNTGGSFAGGSVSLASLQSSANARVGFLLSSNSSGVADGAHVDNVIIRCAEIYSGDSFIFFDGTSMASPHVAGAAALMFAADPGASTGAVRDALLGGVDPLPSLAGATVTGGRLNARRSLDMLLPAPPVAPPPPPPQPVVTATPSAAVVPLAVLARIARQRLLGVLRRGLLVQVNANRAGTATVEVFVDGRTGRRLGLSARSVRVGRRRAAVKAGANRVRVRLTRRARARLRRARRVRLRVRTTIASGAERDRDRLRAVTLRR